MPRPTRSLAYYEEFSKNLYLLKPRNYCIYPLLGHVCCIVTPVAALLNSRHLIIGEGTASGDQSDYTSDYKSRLIKLQLLQLMYVYELSDILFFIKSVKSPNNSFDIMNYVSFSRVPLDLLALNFATELLIIVSLQIHTFTEFPNFGMLFLKLI